MLRRAQERWQVLLAGEVQVTVAGTGPTEGDMEAMRHVPGRCPSCRQLGLVPIPCLEMALSQLSGTVDQMIPGLPPPRPHS